MLLTVGVELLSQRHDLCIEGVNALFVILTLLLTDALSLLTKILFGLSAFRVLLIGRLFQCDLIAIKLSLLVLVVVLGLCELLFLFQASLFERCRLLPKALQHLLDIFRFFNRRFQFVMPQPAHVLPGIAEVCDLILLGDVEFLVQLVLHLLAGENADQLEYLSLYLEGVLSGISSFSGIEFITVQRFHLLAHFLVDLGETIFTVGLSPQKCSGFLSKSRTEVIFGLLAHLDEEFSTEQREDL